MEKVFISVCKWATGLYLLLLAWLVVSRWDTVRLMPLNEIGDTLAGVFSPLAFLWLVIGYFQQKEELAQNTQALLLQAQELGNSVARQAELVKLTEQQISEDRQRHLVSISPNFDISTTRRSYGYGGATPIYVITVLNTGAACVAIRLTGNSPSCRIDYEKESLVEMESWEIPVETVAGAALVPHRFQLLIHYRSRDADCFAKVVQMEYFAHENEDVLNLRATSKATPLALP